MCTRSPSCSTESGRGTYPVPSRVRNATRVPDWICSSRISRPSQLGARSTWASTIVPLGSRHSGSEPCGSRRRSTWSAVQLTVATVGMPRRS